MDFSYIIYRKNYNSTYDSNNFNISCSRVISRIMYSQAVIIIKKTLRVSIQCLFCDKALLAVHYHLHNQYTINTTNTHFSNQPLLLYFYHLLSIHFNISRLHPHRGNSFFLRVKCIFDLMNLTRQMFICVRG